MAIDDNYGRRRESRETSGHHFNPERRRLLLKDYEDLIASQAREKGERQIEDELAGRWDCNIRTVQRNLKKAREEKEGTAAELREGADVYSNAPCAVAVGDWVYMTPIDDTVARARADTAATMPAIGVVAKVLDATTCHVRRSGRFAEASKGWNAGGPVYISDQVAGAVVNVPPVMGIVQKVAQVRRDDGKSIVYDL